MVSNEKYSVLPGQTPVRLSSTEGGHTIIIGETPRTIPEQFEREAIANGCFSESMLAGLQSRLQGPIGGKSEEGGKDDEDDGKDDDERFEKIRAAAIEIINAGNPADLTSGKPRIDVLAAKLGFEVTGAERDAACV